MSKTAEANAASVVERFVLRARRILAHSLCADEDGLERLADSGWYLTREDGVESVFQRLPSEEAVESLAARVRPLLLRDDGLHYTAVISALTTILAQHDMRADVRWCRALKKDWKSVDLKGGTAGYFITVTETVDGVQAPPSHTSDVGLADSWFYGDLVHADQAQIDAGESFGIDTRFAAAAVRTAQVAILARELLAFVHLLIDGGIVAISDAALRTTPVAVETRDLRLAGLHSAPPSTPMPEPGLSLDAHWESVFPDRTEGRWQMRIPWGNVD